MTRRPSDRTAEIAGAGLAGLALSIRLAQLGWRVRLHERGKDLRMFGAGIWLWENGLKVLQILGAFEKATLRAKIIREWRVIDQSQVVLMRRPTSLEDRLLLPPREDLYSALIDRATAAGVDINTSSAVADIRPEGSIILEGGKEYRADLVVVADGTYSRLRDSVCRHARVKLSCGGSVRMLIAARQPDPPDVISEYWNGNLRLGYNPCTDREHYIFLCAPLSDTRARKLPVDKAYWAAKFPQAAQLVERFGEAGRWDRFVSVKCETWSNGRAALIGDAAHAMHPNLGQAANMAFVNAVALAGAVTRTSDVAGALRSWEAQQRPVTEHVQWFSNSYGFILQRCPRPLLSIRRYILPRLGRTGWFEEALNRGARLVPEGFADVPR